MITVRFPSGFSVQYNTATYAVREDNRVRLYDKEGGNILAYAPNDTIVEFKTPCRTYNAIDEADANEIRALRKELRSLTRKIGKV